MATDMIPANLSEYTAVQLFDAGALPGVLDMIEKHARSLVADVSTDKGRKAVASNAYAVSRSKTFLESIGKSHVADLKAKAKVIDEQRATIRDRLDALRDEVRRPLTEIEEAEKAHEDAIKARIAAMAAPAIGSLDELRERLAELEDITIDISFSKFINEADAARTSAINAVKVAIADAEESERKRIVAEEAARKAQAEREERIAREAAERAEIAAREKAEREKAEAQAKAKAEAERQRLAIIAAERAAEQAKREAAESEARRIADAKAAEERQREAEKAAAEAERKRIADEEAARAAIEAKRAANKRHRDSVERDATGAIQFVIDTGGSAEAIVAAIKSGGIPNVSINY